MKKSILKLCYVLTLLIFASSCAQSTVNITATVVPLFTSTPSNTPSPSSTPTATVIPITPAFSGTQAPNSQAVISAENADRLSLLARWGNGGTYDAQYTPDGKYLITARSTGIYFYNTQDYSLVKYIDLGTAILNIAITQDSKKIAVTSYDQVFIFNQDESTPTLTINETASSLAFSPDGQILALGIYSWVGTRFEPGNIKLLDVTTGSMIQEFKNVVDGAQTITFSPDGTRLAAGGYTTQILSLDGKLLDTHGVYVSGGSTYSLSFSPDGMLLAEGAATTNTLHVWRVLSNGRLVIFRTIALHNYPIVFEVAISPDGKLLAAATSNGFFVWELSSGTLIHHKSSDDSRYSNVAWSMDSKSVAAVSVQRGIEIWDSKNDELRQTFNDLTGSITSLAWQPKEKIITSATDNGTIFLLDAQNGNISNTFEGESFRNNFAFSPDGNWLAIKPSSLTKNVGVVIYSLVDRTFHHVLEGSWGDGLSNQSFSNDGRYLVTNGFENGKRVIQVWNTKDWSLYYSWEMENRLVGQLIFCPDGKTIALVESRNSTIKFYKITNGLLTRNIDLSALANNPRLNAISFSPDGKLLLTMSRETFTSDDRRQVLRMWQVDTGNLLYSNKDTQVRQIIPPSPPYYSDTSSSIAWSPNGDLFAAGFSDGVVEVFRASNGKLLQTLSGHTMMIMGVAFSPNGQTLASGSLDGTIRLWGIR